MEASAGPLQEHPGRPPRRLKIRDRATSWWILHSLMKRASMRHQRLRLKKVNCFRASAEPGMTANLNSLAQC